MKSYSTSTATTAIRATGLPIVREGGSSLGKLKVHSFRAEMIQYLRTNMRRQTWYQPNQHWMTNSNTLVPRGLSENLYINIPRAYELLPYVTYAYPVNQYASPVQYETLSPLPSWVQDSPSSVVAPSQMPSRTNFHNQGTQLISKGEEDLLDEARASVWADFLSSQPWHFISPRIVNGFPIWRRHSGHEESTLEQSEEQGAHVEESCGDSLRQDLPAEEWPFREFFPDQSSTLSEASRASTQTGCNFEDPLPRYVSSPANSNPHSAHGKFD
ncbi:hypothetical protein EV356DRAFT_533176 [Viridothelium virens]|uniref:Uncharacterized protein n=1 Tax=Viridothelium virens TaxID=1048519 RepID=A0A6A6H7N8_VIRVR|nr:hypothetical protein EV356DRAFT_533176 [Viridothelium virens]